jgi:chromosome partitioning protein
VAGRIITVAQQKGGSGKTTLAAHLAVALMRQGRSVALLDVDPQGSLGQWYEAREARLGEGAAGFDFRTASGWGARREAGRLARDFEMVVVDTPPKSDLEARPAIEAADLVVIPIQPTPVDLWASEATLQLIARQSAAACLVLNRVPPRALLTAETLAGIARLAAPVAEARLGNRVAFAASMGEGSTVLEAAPGSKGAIEAEALGWEIAAQLA